MMKYERKAEKLGILAECDSIVANCECGETKNAYIVEMSKLRRMDIMEVIGNYLDTDLLDYDVKFKTFLKTYDLKESEVAEVYAKAISEMGYEIAYAVTGDAVLILE